jgi:hypothetical protein
LGGNEVPNWKDNSGSILRRILPWNFTKQVQEADPHLDKKLNKELPVILLKCVRAYLDYSNKFRERDIWNVVPRIFQDKSRSKLLWLPVHYTNFLESTSIKFGEDLFVPQKIFVAKFNKHASATGFQNNNKNEKFHQDFYAGPFSARDIEVRVETVKYKGRTYNNQAIIFGVDIVNEDITFTDDV